MRFISPEKSKWVLYFFSINLESLTAKKEIKWLVPHCLRSGRMMGSGDEKRRWRRGSNEGPLVLVDEER